MRSVSDHVSAILMAAKPVAPLDVVLSDANGCVLAKDVVAQWDVPGRPIAEWDGYAVRARDIQAPGQACVPVVDDAPATALPVHLVPGSAVLIAAGGPIPHGADAVVPLKDTDRGRAQVEIRSSVRPGQGVRPVGSDTTAGTTVMAAGFRLGARHLALAASIGLSRLWVHPAPRVVVVTVGDELIDAGRPLRDGMVHDADGHALVAAARDAGAAAIRVGPVTDDRAVLREVLADQLVRADMLVVTGGLSDGPWDTVADLLAPLGTVRLDQVGMAPGGRQGFGTVCGMTPDESISGRHDDREALLAALPGHPVAALLSFEMFIRPAIKVMAGYADVFRPSIRATVSRPFASPAGMTHVVPGVVKGTPASGYTITPVSDPAHVRLADLARANALALVPEDVTAVQVGDVVGCMVLEG